ncbi:MAG: ATP-binding protein, partial [Thermoanaerobaculia bacterium]
MPKPSIVVAGDVMIDWNLTVERDVTVASRSWREAGKVRSLRQLGGAWLLAELIRKFVGDQADVHGPAFSNDAHQTHTVLLRDSRDVWRVGQFLGVEAADDVNPKLDDDPHADIVVLLDSDLGFDRRKETDWPAAIRDPGHKPWIIFKTSVPAFEQDLWEHLIEHHRDKLIVVMTVEDLRRKQVQLLRRLSWERAAQDLAYEMFHSEALTALNECQHVIVSFGTAGAMHFSRGTKNPRLFFDPARMEAEWEPDRKEHGIMIGYTSVLAAAVTREVLIQPDTPQLGDAIPRGIAGMRALFTQGFGKEKKAIAETEHIAAAALHRDAATTVSVATVTNLQQKTWTILQDRIEAAAAISPENSQDDVLYELAARVAVFGPEVALAEVPQLKIGNLFSVDREEIESLRSIKGLLQEYVERKPSKPLSIAVFGSPGSGKSFAVEEIANAVGGKKIQPLTFNLTQFARADDLHGAFHQVRDVTLRGRIPVVFWDEFDTMHDGQPLGWLRYFIGPMQDGLFQQGQITHPIGTSIFVFAGGTASTKDEFVNQKPARRRDAQIVDRKALKVPDFISRLKGFLNVTGPNRRSANDDSHYLIRRAILLRSLIFKHCPDLFQENILQIDPVVLRGFLKTKRYRHGARSLESIIVMSELAGRTHYDNSSLPPG